MKRKNMQRFGFGLALSVLFVPFVAGAAAFTTGEYPNLPAGNNVDDDMYVFGGNIASASTIFGDLVAGGGNVFVNGSVAEDLAIGGGSVIVSGDVGDDARIAGGNVVMQGAVGGDALVGGGQVNILGPGIGGDLIVGAGVATLSAPVGGDVRIGGGEVVIDARIAGNVEIDADKITIGSNSVIEGDLTYHSPTEATFTEGAIINGTINYEPREGGISEEEFLAGLAVLASTIFLLKFVSLLAAALVIGLFFRRYAVELAGIAIAQPLREIGRGIVFAIVTPIVSVALIATLIGIPLGLLLLTLFVAALILACIVAIIMTGTIVHKWIWKPETLLVNWKTILLGAVVYMFLSLVPFIGWAVQLGIMLLSLGALVKVKGDALKTLR